MHLLLVPHMPLLEPKIFNLEHLKVPLGVVTTWEEVRDPDKGKKKTRSKTSVLCVSFPSISPPFSIPLMLILFLVFGLVRSLCGTVTIRAMDKTTFGMGFFRTILGCMQVLITVAKPFLGGTIVICFALNICWHSCYEYRLHGWEGLE